MNNNIIYLFLFQLLLTSTKHLEKNLIYDFLHPWLGTGLLTSSGKIQI